MKVRQYCLISIIVSHLIIENHLKCINIKYFGFKFFKAVQSIETLHIKNHNELFYIIEI